MTWRTTPDGRGDVAASLATGRLISTTRMSERPVSLPKIVNDKAVQSQTRARAESTVAQVPPALARRINAAHRADVFDVGVTAAEPQAVIVTKDGDFAASCS